MNYWANFYGYKISSHLLSFSVALVNDAQVSASSLHTSPHAGYRTVVHSSSYSTAV